MIQTIIVILVVAAAVVAAMWRLLRTLRGNDACGNDACSNDGCGGCPLHGSHCCK